MKLFLVFLFVASCQSRPSYRISDYVVQKENTLYKLERVVANEISRQLIDEDPKLLVALNYQIPVLIQHAVDTMLAPIDQGSIMAFNMTRNIWTNLRKIVDDTREELDSIPESVQKFLDDLERDIEEMKNHGVFDVYLDDIFDHIAERVALKVEDDIQQGIIGHPSVDLDRLHKTIKDEAESLQHHLSKIKILARDLLAKITRSRNTLAHKALKLFRPFGELWPKLCQIIHDHFNTDQLQTY